MFNIFIVEDNSIIIKYLSDIILKVFPNWNIESSTNYHDAINSFKNKHYDLFIFDYELNSNNMSENGFNLGLELKKCPQYKNTPVIFETSYPEHVLEVLNELNCIYYLIKPYSEKDVNTMINKILSVNNEKKLYTVIDKFGVKTYINENDILFIKSNRHCLNITTLDSLYICTNYTLNEFIDSSNFIIRCHKSYAVNPAFINHIDRTNNLITFTLTSNYISTIPIGRKYKEAFIMKASNE